jgi:hypothetical protein
MGGSLRRLPSLDLRRLTAGHLGNPPNGIGASKRIACQPSGRLIAFNTKPTVSLSVRIVCRAHLGLQCLLIINDAEASNRNASTRNHSKVHLFREGLDPWLTFLVHDECDALGTKPELHWPRLVTLLVRSDGDCCSVKLGHELLGLPGLLRRPAEDIHVLHSHEFHAVGQLTRPKPSQSAVSADRSISNYPFARFLA